MASNLSGLFGGMTKSPEQYRQESIQGMTVSPAQMGQQSLNQQLISQMSNVGANIGSLAGGMMGGQTQQQGDDQRVQGVMQGLDLTNPESIRSSSNQLADMGFPQQAQALREQANEVEDRVMKRQKFNFDTQPKAATPSSLRTLIDERSQYAPGTANYILLTKAIDKATDKSSPQIVQLQQALKGTITGSKEAKEIQAQIAALGRGNVGTGTPDNIEVKDINSIRTNARADLSDYSNVINSAQGGLRFLDLGSPKAEAQVDRALAALSGDTQTSALEINLTSNSGPLGQQIANTISKLTVGGSGASSKIEKQHVLEASLIHNTLQYNSKRDEIISAYQNTNMSDSQITSIVGAPKELPKSLIKRFVEANGEKFEPTKFDYRMSANGSIQRKEKR